MKKLLIVSLLLFVIPITSANAINITYDANDLGNGQWKFDYYVSDFDFAVDSGFQIFYDYGLYEEITVISVSSQWDALAWDPDLILNTPDSGVFDALALEDHASLADPFSVQFLWLGQGNPMAQTFEIYDSTFEIIAFGNTAPIPEPGTLFLLGTGLVGVVAGAKRKKRASCKFSAG